MLIPLSVAGGYLCCSGWGGTTFPSIPAWRRGPTLLSAGCHQVLKTFAWFPQHGIHARRAELVPGQSPGQDEPGLARHRLDCTSRPQSLRYCARPTLILFVDKMRKRRLPLLSLWVLNPNTALQLLASWCRLLTLSPTRLSRQNGGFPSQLAISPQQRSPLMFLTVTPWLMAALVSYLYLKGPAKAAILVMGWWKGRAQTVLSLLHLCLILARELEILIGLARAEYADQPPNIGLCRSSRREARQPRPPSCDEPSSSLLPVCSHFSQCVKFASRHNGVNTGFKK